MDARSHLVRLGALLAVGAAATGCVPELVSPNPPDLTAWSCPDNAWDKATPTEDILGKTYGFFEGDTLPDGQLVDQNGDVVCPWQFWGKVVVVDISTMWCAPCKKIACYAEHTWQTYRGDDVVYLTVLPQDSHGGEVDVEELGFWVDDYHLTSPVISDPEGRWSSRATPNGQYPAILVVDRTLTVRDRIEISGEADSVDLQIRAAVESIAGIPPKPGEPESACLEE